MLDPGPGNWDRTSAICQADHQQLMTIANFGAIHDQMDFSKLRELLGKPLNSNWLIPFTNPNG